MKRPLIDIGLLLEPDGALVRACALTLATRSGFRWDELRRTERADMESAAAAVLRKAAGYLAGGPIASAADAPAGVVDRAGGRA